MKKILTLAILSILIAAVLPGTSWCQPKNPEKVFGPILENLLICIDKGDFKGFVKDLDENMKKKTTLQEFEQMQEQLTQRLGKSKKVIYLGTIDKGDYLWILWKGKFEKHDNEILIKLVSAKNTKTKHQVSGLWFQ